MWRRRGRPTPANRKGYQMKLGTRSVDAADDLFDLDLQVVTTGEPVMMPAQTEFTACAQHTCIVSCTFTCTGATGRPCAC
jgi:hypothetical protein